MKRIVKSSVQRTVAALIPVAWRFAREPRLLVLMYHRVLPIDHPERAFEQPGMYVSPETLRMHLEVLRRHFSLIHLDDWLDRAAAGKSLPPRACAITFDDGWLDNYEYAYPILRAMKCPATIYLVSDLVGTRYVFWPNALMRTLMHELPRVEACPAWFQDLLAECQVLQTASAEQRRNRIDSLIERCKYARSDAEMTEIVTALAPQEAEGRDLVNWSEVADMGRDDLVRFGSHSRRHTRLTDRLSTDMLVDEVVTSSEIIADRLGYRPRTFCYPNGDHCPQATQLVARHYLGAVTTKRGWNCARGDRFKMRRLGMHDDASQSKHQFIARIAGIG